MRNTITKYRSNPEKAKEVSVMLNQVKKVADHIPITLDRDATIKVFKVELEEARDISIKQHHLAKVHNAA
jgi:hypothetical protein